MNASKSGSAAVAEGEGLRAWEFVKRVVDEVGPRVPCSPAEAEAAEVVRAEMEGICDEVAVEPFTCHPRAFLGWIRLDLGLVLLSFFLYYLAALLGARWLALVASVPALVAVLVAWREFFCYDEFVDRLFRERSSQNVVGRILPREGGPPRKLVIFAGHHDSALQFNLLRYLKAGYGVVSFLGLGVMFFWAGASLVASVGAQFAGSWLSGFWPVARRTFWLGLPLFVLLFFFVSSDEKANVVPGAVDNLSAVAVVLALGRCLRARPELVPPGVEVRLVSFGCEEAGLRGAYRYAAAHREELLALDAELYNMDGLQAASALRVLTYEPTTRTRHDRGLVEKALRAASRAGVEAVAFGDGAMERVLGQISGGTDAAAFSKAGLRATSLTSMRIVDAVRYYHQPTDGPEQVDPRALEEALRVCLEVLAETGGKT
ncbi:MAG: hypothetical protein Kow0069_27280 [Promethearchaeota archaeon]